MSIVDFIVGRLRRGVLTFVHAIIGANWDLPFNDSLKVTTTATKVSYQVGKNNQLGRGDQHKLFTSKLTPIFVTTDTYVIFNSTENVAHYLRANTWYNFKININVLTYYYVTEEGTLYAHFGGVLPQEARRPE